MSSPVRPSGSANKSLGEIVGEITQKLTLLVREEIELAKTEVIEKGKRLGKGGAFLAGALLTAIYFSVFFFIALALGINDLFNFVPWVGFGIVTLLFLLVTVVLALLGIRGMKKGTPPTPELAIAEAKKTRAAIGEARR